jgi:hypothetical protein
MGFSFKESDTLQYVIGHQLIFLLVKPPHHGGQVYILLHGQLWNKGIILEDKPQAFQPEKSPLTIIEFAYVSPANEDLSIRWPVKETKHVQQGGFSRPAGPHDTDKLSFPDSKRYILKCMYLHCTHDIHLCQVLNLDHIRTSLRS